MLSGTYRPDILEQPLTFAFSIEVICLPSTTPFLLRLSKHPSVKSTLNRPSQLLSDTNQATAPASFWFRLMHVILWCMVNLRKCQSSGSLVSKVIKTGALFVGASFRLEQWCTKIVQRYPNSRQRILSWFPLNKTTLKAGSVPPPVSHSQVYHYRRGKSTKHNFNLPYFPRTICDVILKCHLN